MFEDWFSALWPDGSGFRSELSPDLGTGLSSGFSSEASGSGSDFVSAWGSGEVYCPGLLGRPANNKRQNYSPKPEYWRSNTHSTITIILSKIILSWGNYSVFSLTVFFYWIQLQLWPADWPDAQANDCTSLTMLPLWLAALYTWLFTLVYVWQIPLHPLLLFFSDNPLTLNARAYMAD